MLENCEADIDGDYAIQMLRRISENDELRQIKLVAGIGQERFSVHRLIMMLSSDYFHALLGLNTEQSEVTIPDVDSATLKSIIEYCYSGNINITDKNVMQIIEAATAMKLVLLQQKCEQFWIDNLTTSNCVKMFKFADERLFTYLRKKSLRFICEHFNEITCDELTNLPFGLFSEILKRDNIHALEELILERMIEWVELDTKNRKQYAARLFKSIRLEKIPQPILVDAVEKFARKYNCLSFVTNEYRRRVSSDGQTVELYRYSDLDAKSVFSVSIKNDAADINKYNPISDRWEVFRNTKLASMNDRKHYGIVAAENKLYLIGGYENQVYKRAVDAFELDSLQQFQRNRIGTARALIVPIYFDHHIYLFGGWNGILLRSCECFPVNSEFKAKTLQPMQYGRYNYASAVVGDKIYVAGGKNGRGSYMSSVECYDHVNNTWTEVSSMNRPRAKFALAESNGRLYAMGHVDVIERYDPAQDVWTVIGFFDDSETIKQGVTLRSEIYVLTSNTFGKFKPERGCSLLSLRCVPNTNAIEHTLFVN